MSSITPDTTIREYLFYLVKSGNKAKAWEFFRNWFTPEDQGSLYWSLVHLTEEVAPPKD